jgi:hypothetical protein
MSRVNQFQLKQILAKRFSVAIEAIARLEKWNTVYFLIIKGRKPRFVSMKGFFTVPNGYGLTKRTNANIVSDNHFQIRYMAENAIIGEVTYEDKKFKARTLYNSQGLVGMTYDTIEKAIAFVIDRHTMYLKLSIIGF